MITPVKETITSNDLDDDELKVYDIATKISRVIYEALNEMPLNHDIQVAEICGNFGEESVYYGPTHSMTHALSEILKQTGLNTVHIDKRLGKEPPVDIHGETYSLFIVSSKEPLQDNKSILRIYVRRSKEIMRGQVKSLDRAIQIIRQVYEIHIKPPRTAGDTL
jgi:hypothetical protein